MRQQRRAFLAGLFACPACAAAAQAEAIHWNYEGAAKWGALDGSYKSCSIGAEQSPIDLKGAIPASLGQVAIDWTPQAFVIVNNGHTIQANAAPGGSLTLGSEKFDLKQFHFHTPSEHAVDGKRTAMEAHFVHAQPGGKLAVVGMLMVAGPANAGFAEVMRTAPKGEGEAKLNQPLNPNAFLPNNRAMIRYEGSLTTPPCSELVDWNVLVDPIAVAAADIEAFRTIFPMNARPLQPTGRRFLLRGS